MITFDETKLREVVKSAVHDAADAWQHSQSQLGDDGKLAYAEEDAARLIGVSRWTLRDLRLEGKVKATKLGRRRVYAREELARLLIDEME